MKNKTHPEPTHTFAVCAYKESPYLETCILSLKAQTLPAKIVIATSTPNAFIDGVAERYGIPVVVNPKQKGIGFDFDFALHAGDTKLITIAHQDDQYDPKFSEMMVRAWREDMLIAFTDYREIDKDGVTLPENRNLRIKKLLLFPLRCRFLQRFRLFKRGAIAIGNGICCPSVTFSAEKMPEKLFSGKMKSNVDWSAWEILSRKKGSFIYIPKERMSHRIHEEATTTKLIHDHKRTAEDYAMYRRFWPAFIAKRLCRLYSRSEDTVTRR